MPTPYNKYVYHLDLCVLAYQLHAQTLLFPFDPYFEESNHKNPRGSRGGVNSNAGGDRKAFMDRATNTMVAEKQSRSANVMLRGPGDLCRDGSTATGWATNPKLDAVFSDYARVDPWRPGFTRPNKNDEELLVYNAPFQITDKICEVYFALVSGNAGPSGATPIVHFLQPNGKTQSNSARLASRPTTNNSPTPPYATQVPRQGPQGNDLLYCFEGGTGQIEPTTPPLVNPRAHPKSHDNRSLMGYCLARPTGASGFDLHIVFRGSRSGQRRYDDAKKHQRGSPDWVTNMQFEELDVDHQICGSLGAKVSRGYAYSLHSMLPTITACLNGIQQQFSTRNLGEIYVTGHSLGGALANLFASTMIKGTKPTNMSQQVKIWNWNNLHLVTFSAPVVGNRRFKDAMRQQQISRFMVDGDIVALYNRPRFFCLGKKIKLINPVKGGGFGSAHSPDVVRAALIRRIILAQPVANSRRLAPFGAIERRPNQPEYVPAVAQNGNAGIAGAAQDGSPWRSFKTLQEAFAHMAEIESCGLYANANADGPHFFNPGASLIYFAKVLDGQLFTPTNALPNHINKLVRKSAGNLLNTAGDDTSPTIQHLFTEDTDIIYGDRFDGKQLRALKIALLMFYIQGDNQRYTDAVVNGTVPFFADLIAEEHV